MSEEIFTMLIELVHKIKPETDITRSSILQDDLDFDSLDKISLLFDMERKFEIKIPEADIEQHDLSSINGLVDYILFKKNKGHIC